MRVCLAYCSERTRKSAAHGGQLKRVEMQSAVLQLSPSPQQRGRDPRLTGSPAAGVPVHMFRSPFEQAEISAWQPNALPDPETEAFLTNLCINVEDIATRTFYPGEGLLTAARAPLRLFYVLDGHGTYSNSAGARTLAGTCRGLRCPRD